jgi:hypothetical protein
MPLIPYGPAGGINQEDPEISLGEQEVRGATNFLFERKLAVSRPGLQLYSMGSVFSTPRLGWSKDFGALGIKTVLVSGNQIYSLDSSSLNATEITGAGLTIGDACLSSIAVVNALVMVGYNTGGLARWDPTGGTYTVISAAPYRFVCGHISRAVAARKIGSGLTDPYSVAWSTAGDETDWTSFGAGSAVLPETSSEIMGIANIRNVLVFPRTDGFHLGYSTGVSTPAFRFELHSSDAVGPTDMHSFCHDGATIYFVGRDDVYSFNTVETVSIGRQIRRELLGYMRGGVLFRGFISRGIGLNPRSQYHLVPLGASGVPHFVYDIGEEKWSRHSYAWDTATGWFQLKPDGTSAPALVNTIGTTTAWLWDEQRNCEVEQSLLGRSVMVGEMDRDIRVQRLMVLYRNLSNASTEAQFSMSSELNDTPKTTTTSVVLREDARWSRRWATVEAVGQLFRPDLTIPADSRVEIAAYGLLPSDSGDHKGA